MYNWILWGVSSGVICDDDNVLTDDYCNDETGCYYVPKQPCDDYSACTRDFYDDYGNCDFEVIDCDDDNACTNDDCDISTRKMDYTGTIERLGKSWLRRIEERFIYIEDRTCYFFGHGLFLSDHWKTCAQSFAINYAFKLPFNRL